MIYTRHTCTAAFRAGLLALYPGLGTNRAYWQFMGALIFPQHPDDETGQTILALTNTELSADVNTLHHDLCCRLHTHGVDV